MGPRSLPAVHRVAHLQRRHGLDELLLETVGDRLLDQEALGGDAALAGIDGPRLGRLLAGLHRIDVAQDDERIGATQLENGLLEVLPGLRGYRHAGLLATGEGDGANRRMGDEALDGLRGDEESAHRSVRESGVAEDLLDGKGAAGNVRGVLQQADVARHQGRGREAEELPEREIPRHDGEHRPERVVADEAAGGVGDDRLLSEETLRGARRRKSQTQAHLSISASEAAMVLPISAVIVLP